MRGLLRRWKSHSNLICALVASLALTACLFQPEWPLPTRVYRTMVVLDITQSMNTRDYHQPGFPEDRLGYSKKVLREWLHALPCGSEVGLGLFTTQTVHFLFEPLEICRHFAVIDDSLEHIDWRMAWSADTHVEMGLHYSIRELQKIDPDLNLAFFTDGQETPPQSLPPPMNPDGMNIKGVIIGVGGLTPVTVPRYDRENRSLGIWENADIEKPPVSTTVYSEKIEVRTLPTEGPYLSWLDESHLKALSAMTGFHYQRLEKPEDVVKSLMRDDAATWRITQRDLRPFLGGISLLALLSFIGMPRRREIASWVHGALDPGYRKTKAWFFS